MLTKQERRVALQHLLSFPMRRSVQVSATEAGFVRVEVTHQRTGEQVCWMEMDPKEAEMLAGYLWSTVTEIIGKRHAAAKALDASDA